MPRDDWPIITAQTVFNGQYPTQPINSVLDIGCGLSVKSQYLTDVKQITAVDIHRPYLEQARKQAIRDDIVYINHDALKIDRLFLPQSFDIVLLQDVIEHFPKADALRLIEMAKSLARIAVIVNTPEGFIEQNMDTWHLGGDQYQTHRSAWVEHNLTDLGFIVKRRKYTMCDVIRHTTVRQKSPDIMVLDGIWYR